MGGGGQIGRHQRRLNAPLRAIFVSRVSTTFVPLCRIEFFAAGFFERRQIVLRKFPQNIRRNMIVTMPKDVTDTRYLRPRNLGLPRLNVLRQMPARF
jgi:hypothetical protein